MPGPGCRRRQPREPGVRVSLSVGVMSGSWPHPTELNGTYACTESGIKLQCNPPTSSLNARRFSPAHRVLQADGSLLDRRASPRDR